MARRRFANVGDALSVFKQAWHGLTLPQAEAVLRDIAALADEEFRGDDLAASRVLLKRIGGVGNLKSYGRTMEVSKQNPRRRSNPGARRLTVPEQHQLRIARDTLKMSDAMARVMGGPTKTEAVRIIQRLTGKTPRVIDFVGSRRPGGNPRRRRRIVARRGRRNPVAKVKTGDRVRIDEHTGTVYGYVTRVGRSGSIVFVQLDGAPRERWYHAVSVHKEKAYPKSVRVRRNPVALSESSMWKRVREIARAVAKKDFALARELEDISWAALQQLKRGVHENPTLAVVGALNPPLGAAVELRYKRTAGAHPGYYRHKFTSRATVFAMKDGSLRIVGR